MNERRKSFLSCSRTALSLAAGDEVASAWEGPSALDLFSLRGLVGHLMRATATVETYLDADAPGAETISPAAYYAAAIQTDDISAQTHVDVRTKGEEKAAAGREALLREWDDVLGRLEPRFARESPDRRVRVFAGLAMSLDDYLVTRIIETIVHADDVAVSVGVPTPAFPQEAMEAAIYNLVDVGRHRHGDLAVLRALTRRERDAAAALRVL